MRRILLWTAPLLFLAAFFFYPLTRIMLVSFDFTVLNADTLRLTYQVSAFTFFQASLSTMLTLLLGLPSAYLFSTFEFRGKPLLRTLTAVPFMLPTVVVAAGFNALLGPRGLTNFLLMEWLHLETPPVKFLGTLSAILIAHVFYNTTVIIRIMGNAMANLDTRLEEAARTLGATALKTFQHVTVPLLLPSLLACVLLVFLFDFTSFGVILLLGGAQFSTLEVEIFNQAIQRVNLPLAAWLSILQLAFTLLISIFYSAWSTRSTRESMPMPGESRVRKAVGPWEKTFLAGMITFLLAFYFLPLSALPVRSLSRLEAERGQRGDVRFGITSDYYAELFTNRLGSVFYVPPMQAATNSLFFGTVTILLSLLLGYPAAVALSKPALLERILDPILVLPLGASAVTLGLGFILSYGRWLASPMLVPVAHTLIALPFVIRTLQPAIATIPIRLRQAAASLGASPFEVWRTVDWPILSRATLAASLFAFTISLGEFGAAILITRPEYPTLPVAIYRFLSQPGGLNYGQAMAMATLLMMMTAIGILIIEKVKIPGTEIF